MPAGPPSPPEPDPTLAGSVTDRTSDSGVPSVRGDGTVRALTVRYLVALGLVALLSIAACLGLQRAIATQDTAAAIINWSGVRRYTSQRATLAALRLAMAEDVGARDRSRAALLADLDRLERAHRGLIDGDPARRLPGRPSPAIAALYWQGGDAADPLVVEFLRRGRALAAASDGDHLCDREDLAWMLATGPGRLLDVLDGLVFAYQRESEAEIARIQTAELVVLAATLAVLALEALFIFRPMAERVRVERARLVAAEACTRRILDHGHDGIATLDGAGRIASANPALARMLVTSVPALVGRPLRELLPGGGPLPERGVVTLTGRRSDGEELAVDAAFNPLPGDRPLSASSASASASAAGAAPVAVAIMRESTVRLRHYARELERRNQELDQFAYAAAHDLMAPLRAIANLSRWIEADLADRLSSEGRSQFDLLRARVLRLHALIDGLHHYAVSGRGRGRPEPIDVALLVREVVEVCDPQRTWTLDLAADLPPVTADRSRLWGVFANLIGNAIRHHHRGAGRLAVGWRDVGEHIEFAVGDDGPGIAAEHHQRIFVIFQTLAGQERAGSLGLGLALVRRIVKAAGGEVAVDSAPGRGSTFRFTWPRQPPADAETAA